MQPSPAPRNIFTESRCYDPPQSTTPTTLHPMTKTRRQALATSRVDVQQLHQKQRLHFVEEAAKASSMVPLSLSDQHFALLMLVSEGYRYNTQPKVKPRRKLHRAPLSTTNSPNATSILSKKERKEIQNTYRCLQKDVDFLLVSVEWDENPEPTTSTHPYLFTLRELQCQNLFCHPRQQGGPQQQ
jgi:hypothetical protein